MWITSLLPHRLPTDQSCVFSASQTGHHYYFLRPFKFTYLPISLAAILSWNSDPTCVIGYILHPGCSHFFFFFFYLRLFLFHSCLRGHLAKSGILGWRSLTPKKLKGPRLWLRLPLSICQPSWALALLSRYFEVHLVGSGGCDFTEASKCRFLFTHPACCTSGYRITFFISSRESSVIAAPTVASPYPLLPVSKI